MFNNKSILITGGTGSFGQEYTKFLLKNYNVKKILIFSRDEQKHNMQNKFNSSKLRFYWRCKRSR